jgi:Uma2 family endonuclease
MVRAMAAYRATIVRRRKQYDTPAKLEFPGCRPVRISRAEIVASERRIEYWDAATETAMVCEPVSTYHEHPGQRLRELLTTIAHLRGSPIATFGAADLLQRDAQGAWLRILEADQTVYLHPRTTGPEGARIEVGSDTLPDVVLEVDNTTDVRRGKLSLYASWGFPEVWVEVPDRYSPSRPAGLRPGLTIYLQEGGDFRTAASSRAFPGWTAHEIHQALNEPEVSNLTMAALRRVARALGAALGTGPDDDLLLSAERRESRAQGQVEGRLETRRDAVLQVLRSRGVPVSAQLPRSLAEFASVPTAALVQAALECRDETDLLRLIRRR